MRKDSESGAAALIVAGALLFLLGSAALAVDVSGFYVDARTDQTTADLACLAGVAELPDDAAALNMAATYAQLNWPEMGGATLVPLTAQSAMLDDGNGNTVLFETGLGGQPDQMRITVSEASETRFGRVLGADAVQVTQEATCSQGGFSGTAVQPFGAAPGWDGTLQVQNPCDTGNCRPLDIPRSDVNGGGNRFIRNVSLGADRTLEAMNTTVCTDTTPVCGILNQNQGVSAGQLADGMLREGAGVLGRLRDTSVADTPLWSTPGGRLLDADSVSTILGAGKVPLDSVAKPSGWIDEVHGTFPPANAWYVDGMVGKCTSPRLVKVPIIAQVGWTPGDTIVLPNGNSDPVQIIGFFDAVIVDPNDNTDLKNGASDNLTTASAEIWWPGPNAKCTFGSKVMDWSEVTEGFTTVKLVAG